MPAALLMAHLQATLRAQTAVCRGPKECLERSNALLYRSTDADKFATLFYGVLDIAADRFTYVNAGHNYPLLLKVGCNPERVDLGGLVLGCMEEFLYSEGEIELAPGDLLLVYSDGITESTNANEEEYGEQRLAVLLGEQCGRRASEIIETIVESVRGHAGGAAQSDDITLLVIRRES
jgi:sigma-B regulation protein RsbU (phosphoserine phosphatase)